MYCILATRRVKSIATIYVALSHLYAKEIVQLALIIRLLLILFHNILLAKGEVIIAFAPGLLSAFFLRVIIGILIQQRLFRLFSH